MHGDPTATAAPVQVNSGRLTSVDALRGLVMVVMVLDHTRDFLQDMSVDAMDLATTTAPLFFTRWITHFCAPVFVFLAGASAYLMLALGKERTSRELARFLVSRGLFLMVLELTVVRLGWHFSWSPDGMFLQVIWVIGLSMVLLGLLVGGGMSPRWIGILGAAIVMSHNLLDMAAGPPAMDSMGRPAPQGLLFTLLLRPGPLPLAPGVTWFVGYCLLPWFGIMALGYAFGQVLTLDRQKRVRLTAALGLGAVLAFVLVRISGLYGDPNPFRVQETPLWTLMALVNCQKYPPSLLFALMTLGPGLLMLAALDATEGAITLHGRNPSALRKALVTLGRVPLFYYVLQWPVIHVMAKAVNTLAGRPVPWTFAPFGAPLGFSYSLLLVYLMWALVVAILYVPCRWYAELKQRRKDWTWLSYV
jgi:uncharacterized membrane protein